MRSNDWVDHAHAGGSGEEIGAWLRRSEPSGAKLRRADLALAPGQACVPDAAGFDRDTFLCGQAGSGKTYSTALDDCSSVGAAVVPSLLASAWTSRADRQPGTVECGKRWRG